jgi:hypothetical protein
VIAPEATKRTFEVIHNGMILRRQLLRDVLDA